MSCYFRHLQDLFAEAGIQVTPANKKQVDQAFHQVLNVTYKDCPATWKAFKAEVMNDPQKRQEFIRSLKIAVGG